METIQQFIIFQSSTTNTILPALGNLYCSFHNLITVSGKELPRRSLQIGMYVGRSLGFIERVAALVRLPHPVDNEHDEEDRAEQSHHCSSYYG